MHVKWGVLQQAAISVQKGTDLAAVIFFLAAALPLGCLYTLSEIAAVMGRAGDHTVPREERAQGSAAAAPCSLPRSNNHSYARADSDSVCLVAGTDLTYHEKTLSYFTNK